MEGLDWHRQTSTRRMAPGSITAESMNGNPILQRHIWCDDGTSDATANAMQLHVLCKRHMSCKQHKWCKGTCYAMAAVMQPHMLRKRYMLCNHHMLCSGECDATSHVVQQHMLHNGTYCVTAHVVQQNTLCRHMCEQSKAQQHNSNNIPHHRKLHKNIQEYQEFATAQNTDKFLQNCWAAKGN